MKKISAVGRTETMEDKEYITPVSIVLCVRCMGRLDLFDWLRLRRIFCRRLPHKLDRLEVCALVVASDDGVVSVV